jgi:hypothetical protein
MPLPGFANAIASQGEQQAHAFARFFLTGSNLPSARLWRLLVDVSLRWMLTTVEYEDELRKPWQQFFSS